MNRTLVAQLQLAIMMLTRLPAGRLQDPVPTLGEASWAFPIVGAIVGTVGWLAFAAAIALGLSPVLAALVAVTATALVTGALHFDGLADFADGIGGGQDAAHCLEIMRDSRIGSYGVLALILTVGLTVTAMAETGGPTLAAFLFLAVVSRLTMTAVLILLPTARSDGLGALATGSSIAAIVPGLALAVVLSAFVGVPALITMATMCVAAALLAKVALARIQGQTGDVLGATQVACEAVGWVTLSAALA